MPLTKVQKEQAVNEFKDLLNDSRLTVVANYSGVTVQEMQRLRKIAKEQGTNIKVVKNRLAKIAFDQSENMKNADTTALNSQLLYAFNSLDEVAPAQSLKEFQKTNPNLEFVGAFTSDGHFLDANDVNALANLPGKEQLRGQLVGVISAPIRGFIVVIKGNLQGFVGVLNSRAEAIK